MGKATEPTYEQKKLLICISSQDRRYLRLMIPKARVYIGEATEKLKIPKSTVRNCFDRIKKNTGVDGRTFLGFLQISKAVTAGDVYLRERYPQGIPPNVSFKELFEDEVF